MKIMFVSWIVVLWDRTKY